MRCVRWAVVGPLAFLLGGTPAFSWHDKGHRIVAAIAASRLSPAGRTLVRELLAPGETLADAAVWPDYDGRRIRELDVLHYVNIADGSQGYRREVDCPEGNCAIEALRWCEAQIADRNAPLHIRRIALRYLAHLTGDLHQPLHAGRAADRGGTTISLIYGGTVTSLHLFWDKDLVEMEEGEVEEVARRLVAGATPAEWESSKSGDPAEWANESLRLAMSHAYTIAPSGEPDEDYIRRAREVVRRRLLQAGLRLARVIDRLAAGAR
ncbi:MAG TPA: S1/P1 nuclease [candidate division Zixibacteria bacterium]|nr:S1/P1 nuclease [candidate division Zixibacteria bacterium]